MPTHRHSNQTCRVTDFLRRTSTRRLDGVHLMWEGIAKTHITHIGRVNSNPTPPKAMRSASISRIAEADYQLVWLLA